MLHIGPATDSRFNRSWVVGPDLSPDLLREGGEREDDGSGVFEVFGDLGELLDQSCHDPVGLGVDRVGVGLVVVECNIALTHPHDDFGVIDIRFAA